MTAVSLSLAREDDSCCHTKPGRIILHADMDSFYASAEVQRRPELAGRPVVVGADPKGGSGRGVACTCSYEARAYGIRSAMPVSQAYILCPHAVFIQPDFPYYHALSRAIMDLLQAGGHPFLQVSIDEAYLDLSACGSFDAAAGFAGMMQDEIRERFGLTCSVGIAGGKTLAKIASDHKKPGGLTIIRPESARGFLAPLPVKKVPGIGSRAESELLHLGIRTIGDLAAADVQRLVGRFGRSAVALQTLAQGIDEGGIGTQGEVKSISRETTFETDTPDPEVLFGRLDALAHAARQDLASASLRCRTITVKVRYQGFITRTKSRTLSHYTGDLAPILASGRSLFSEIFDDRPVRLIGIRLSTFERPDCCQTTLGV